ncbi:LOW QUALITY PROTEIN: hypothetical protein KIPB_000646, partial [Kipferlia bialata]
MATVSVRGRDVMSGEVVDAELSADTYVNTPMLTECEYPALYAERDTGTVVYLDDGCETDITVCDAWVGEGVRKGLEDGLSVYVTVRRCMDREVVTAYRRGPWLRDVARGFGVFMMVFAHSSGGAADTAWFLELDTPMKRLMCVLFAPTIFFAGWRGSFPLVAGIVYGYNHVSQAMSIMSSGVSSYMAHHAGLL